MPDDRSQREKLEAMAHQKASPREASIAERILFRRYGHKHDPNALKLSTKGEYRDAGPFGFSKSRGRYEYHDEPPQHPRRDPAPHVYQPGPGGDAYGCMVCGRSKDNPRANHVKVVGG